MVKYFIRTLIISTIFFTSSVYAERLTGLKAHVVFSNFGKPDYSYIFPQGSSSKFIWIEKKFTIVCMITLNAQSVCSADGSLDDNSFFDPYRSNN